MIKIYKVLFTVLVISVTACSEKDTNAIADDPEAIINKDLVPDSYVAANFMLEGIAYEVYFPRGASIIEKDSVVEIKLDVSDSLLLEIKQCNTSDISDGMCLKYSFNNAPINEDQKSIFKIVKGSIRTY